MSQNTARHDPHARSGDEDVVDAQARQPEHKRGIRPLQADGRPASDDGTGPDEPGEEEFALIGDDDLGPADLGPVAPNYRDPDAGSGRIRKMPREGDRGTGRQ
jgi:hypothetical protein